MERVTPLSMSTFVRAVFLREQSPQDIDPDELSRPLLHHLDVLAAALRRVKELECEAAQALQRRIEIMSQTESDARPSAHNDSFGK